MATKNYERGTSIGERLHDVQEIKQEIDRLTRLLDEHKAYLLGHAIRHDLDSLSCGPLVVSRRARATWFYSESIKQAERRLKARKAQEQDKGIAKCELSEHLVVSFSARVALQLEKHPVEPWLLVEA